MKILVLEIQKGGLGDHLFYSHIPRIAKEIKLYDKVLISNHSLFRHPDYKKIVWELNPYIDGFTNEKGIFHSASEVGENENLLDKLMLLYGLDDGLRFHEPEIYYQPIINPKYQNIEVYDPNYISYTGDLASGKLIEKWFRKSSIPIAYQMKIFSHRNLKIACTQFIETSSLFEFCSLIVSCKRMYCLTTGTATLAAALKIPVTVFYGEGHIKMYRHTNLHDYVYLGTDYTLNDKFKKWLVLFLSKFIQIGAR